jgi:hypothetical protein
MAYNSLTTGQPMHHVKSRLANMPVQSTYTAEGWISTGLTFEDYAGMHQTKLGGRSAVCNRKLETPEWACSDEKLRVLLVVYLEDRADLPHLTSFTLSERLAIANKALAE